MEPDTSSQENTLTVEQGIYQDIQAFAEELFNPGSEKDSPPNTDLTITKGTSLSVILDRLNLLVNSNTSHNSRIKPDVYNLVSVLSLSIRGYLSLAPKADISSLGDRVLADTVGWLSQLFRYENGSGYFHEVRIDGLLKVAKLALYLKYAKYATDGFTALYTRPPVIYISAAAPPSLGKDLKTHLGLPQSSICIVPCNSMFGSPYTMDVTAFERLLTDDVSCGKTPLLLIGFAGTPLAGHTDNLSRLREVCTQSGVWLHVEGDTLTTLALPQVPSSVSAATNADSVTLDVATWFGLYSQPYCTLFRTSNIEVALSVGLVSSDPLEKLHCLPLWIAYQFMGTEDLQKIISHASEISQQLSDRIDAVKGLKRFEQINTTSPVVVFKYKAAPELRSDSLSSQEDEEEEEKEDSVEVKGNRSAMKPVLSLSIPPQLTDELNRLILKEINNGHIFEAVTVARDGLCIKFNPYPVCKDGSITKDDIDKLIEKLEVMIDRLDSSLLARSGFEEAMKKVSNAVTIDTGIAACVGAFQCIPKYWKTTNVSNLSDSKKREVNSLNSEVVDKLLPDYPNLTLLKNSTGQNYISVGFSATSLDLSKFVEDIITCLDEVEDNSMFLESVSESVQKSILEAEERLLKESEEKLLEGGLLRLVPVVGSFYNWLSPPPKDDLGVTGRSFQIAKGRLESTEKTYKLKMQVTDDDEEENVEKLSQAGSAAGSIQLDQTIESNEDVTQPSEEDISFLQDIEEKSNSEKPEESVAETVDDTGDAQEDNTVDSVENDDENDKEELEPTQDESVVESGDDIGDAEAVGEVPALSGSELDKTQEGLPAEEDLGTTSKEEKESEEVKESEV